MSRPSPRTHPCVLTTSGRARHAGWVRHVSMRDCRADTNSTGSAFGETSPTKCAEMGAGLSPAPRRKAGGPRMGPRRRVRDTTPGTDSSGWPQSASCGGADTRTREWARAPDSGKADRTPMGGATETPPPRKKKRAQWRVSARQWRQAVARQEAHAPLARSEERIGQEPRLRGGRRYNHTEQTRRKRDHSRIDVAHRSTQNEARSAKEQQHRIAAPSRIEMALRWPVR